MFNPPAGGLVFLAFINPQFHKLPWGLFTVNPFGVKTC